MSASTSKVVSHGSIYLAGNILRRVVSFVMLPIYTRYLAPEHYGTLELLSMVIDFVAILFGMKVGEAIFRFYFEYDDERDRREVIFTSMALVCVLNAVGVAFLLVGAKPLAQAIFGSTDAARLLALFSFTLIFQSVTETVFTYIRTQQRPWMFVGFSTLKLVVQLTMNIYFVVVLRMAVEGVVLSALVSGVIVSVPLLWYMLSRTGVAFSGDKARMMVSFSYPLVLTSVISFYMTFGDRYFLRVLGGGLDEVGVYALGYRFGFLLSFFVGEPFFNVWNSEKYLAVRQPDARERIGSTFLMFTAALVWVMAGISIFVRDIFRLMSDPAFWGAYLIVPVVLLGYLFNNWAGFTNLGLLLHKKTGEIATGTAIAACLITIAYLVLIPAFGGVGAALATAIAFGCRTVWVTWRAGRLHPLGIPWGRAFAILAVGSVAWAVSLLGPEPLWWSIGVDALIFLSFSVALVTLPGLLSRNLRQAVLHAVRDRSLKVRHLGGWTRQSGGTRRRDRLTGHESLAQPATVPGHHPHSGQAAHPPVARPGQHPSGGPDRSPDQEALGGSPA